MKKHCITFIILFFSFPIPYCFAQTYMNIKYQGGSEKYKEINSLRKITFTSSGSQINYNLTDNTTVTEDVSTLRKITFGTSGSGDPLPVELINFTAVPKDNSVVVNWSTATEVNNYGFEIERLKNCKITKLQDKLWETVGFVEGHGNSNSPKQYYFIDESVGTCLSMQSVTDGVFLQYRLKQIDTDGGCKYYSNIAEVDFNITDIKEKQLPTEFSLSQNYPNPFNPTTTIGYAIPTPLSLLRRRAGGEVGTVVHVTLKVYDILGKEVAILVNEEKAPGYYSVKFDGCNFSAGIYIYKLNAGSSIAIKKLMLIK